MAVTKEYVAGIALVYRLCRERSPEWKALEAKIRATGTSPDFVFGGATNEDTVHGVNAALQTLEGLKLNAPDVTDLLKRIRPMDGGDVGGEADVCTHELEALDKTGFGDRQDGADSVGCEV